MSKKTRAKRPKLEVIMKKIKNDSLQGLEVYILVDNAHVAVHLPPRGVIEVEESSITRHVKTLQKRKMIKVY